MIEEIFSTYKIISKPVLQSDGKWSVSAEIIKETDGLYQTRLFQARDRIHYILEEEAAKEGINLGKNLIKRNLAGF